MRTPRIALIALSVFLMVAAQGATPIRLTRVEYEDRVRAVWTAQIIAVLLAWPHEHQVASSVWLENFPKPYKAAPVDDDWYYEMCAVRAFASVWSGGGDFLKTVNLAAHAADFTDADCNAANAASVVGAMHGMTCLPKDLVDQLGDRIVGGKMGPVALTPPVNESISDLAKRTAAVGEKIITANGGKIDGAKISIPVRQPITQPAELFELADLMQYWNSDWKLERAGFGGAGGGMGGIRGITYLDGDVLATYPRDEVRGLVLRRTSKLSGNPTLTFQAGVDPGRAWELNVYANNKQVFNSVIAGADGGRQWREVKVDLSEFA